MVQEMVTVGELSMGHARALSGVPYCEGLARAVADKGLSVRETEKRATRAKPGRSNGKISVSKKSSSDDAVAAGDLALAAVELRADVVPGGVVGRQCQARGRGQQGRQQQHRRGSNGTG